MEQKKEEKRSFTEWVRKFATCQGRSGRVVETWEFDIKAMQELCKQGEMVKMEKGNKDLADRLFEATQLVKSGDPELADMGRKWVKELIWGKQEKVEVKPGDAELVESRKIDGEEITHTMIGSIKGGVIGDTISKEFKIEPLFIKRALISGVTVYLMEGIQEYFDPHHGEWLPVRGKEHAAAIKDKGWKQRRTFKEVVE